MTIRRYKVDLAVDDHDEPVAGTDVRLTIRSLLDGQRRSGRHGTINISTHAIEERHDTEERR